MRNILLMIIFTMLMSALYAVQNTASITISILLFSFTVQQGIWEVGLFCGGAFIMLICSLFSMAEQRRKYREKIDVQNDYIRSIEMNQKQIIETLASVSKQEDLPITNISATLPLNQLSEGNAEKEM